MSDYKINTKCLVGGYKPGSGEPRQIPIIQSTTFKYDTCEEMGRLFDLEVPGTSILACKIRPAIMWQRSLRSWRAALRQC